MKIAAHTDVKMRPNLPYPNAASRQERLHKVLDLALTAAIGAAIAACLTFLIVLA